MKTKFKFITWAARLVLLSTFTTFYVAQFSPVFAQGTAFNYQGRLNEGTNPANGSYDLTFTIYGGLTGGSPVAGPATNSAIGVSNGLFSVTLDFGAGVFTGPDRWLEIGVRTNGTGAFSVLAPRQPITPVPYAIMANSASNLLGILPAAQLTSIGNTNGGSGNFFVGQSGNSTMSGYENTAYGEFALGNNTSGTFNTANGNGALNHNTSGSYNTAYGYAALENNTNGNDNTAIGALALIFNTSGSGNTAIGRDALFANASGSFNTALGGYALFLNTIGSYNTAIGSVALYSNTNGSYNTAIGDNALTYNTSGSYNTANGYLALLNNTNGSYNTAMGQFALSDNASGSGNTAIGSDALEFLTTGSGNIALGASAGSAIYTGNNNIDIGNTGFGDESGVIRIGTSQTKAVFNGIYGGNIASSSELVCVNSSGLLGTVPAGGVSLPGDLQIGTSSGDYHHMTLGGGNSYGYLYGSYNKYSDGIHLGYNYYADSIGGSHFGNSGGGTSRISLGYNSISLATGDVGVQPNFNNVVVSGTTTTVNGTFNNMSDRNAKQDFAAVSPSQILDKVTQLPLSEWSYKVDAATRHIGAMAQDFYAAFNVGTDDKHIAPIDEGGVALAAIQGLNQKLEEQAKQRDAEIQNLKQQNNSLAERLNELETTVKSLTEKN